MTGPNIMSFFILTVISTVKCDMNDTISCKNYKNGPSLDVRDLVGIWVTVYTQPNTVNCFTLNIRATTDLEREQLTLKYGNLSGRADWGACLLQVQSTDGKHFLQGNGSDAGLLQNIVIEEDEKGKFSLQEQNADQWTMFGRRGAELLLMKDCSGEALAIFCRAPYWPATADLYAILHRSGIRPLTRQRVLCEPLNQCYNSIDDTKGKN